MMQNTLFRPSVVREARANFNPEGFDLAAVLKARQAGEEVEGDNTFKDLDCTTAYKSAEFLSKPLPKDDWASNFRAMKVASSIPPAKSIRPVRLASGVDFTATIASVIQAAYKQVFGNTYLMACQRVVEAESKLRNGQYSVQDFVRALAKSGTYRDLFFERCSNVRVVELNIKHLLGRAPDSFAEVASHLAILQEQGFEADIDSYIDSAEYTQNFGLDTVPYYVGYATQTGKSGAGYNRIFKLVKGFASSDRSIGTTIVSSQRSQLQTALL